mmetsp:Transcript_3511/g.5392  ORF Transcript_3511/g.5392 Transcript_3511/m.5392 type:complete len:157 (-) Transcript_3511:495-965(-)
MLDIHHGDHSLALTAEDADDSILVDSSLTSELEAYQMNTEDENVALMESARKNSTSNMSPSGGGSSSGRVVKRFQMEGRVFQFCNSCDEYDSEDDDDDFYTKNTKTGTAVNSAPPQICEIDIQEEFDCTSEFMGPFMGAAATTFTGLATALLIFAL